MKQIPRIEKYMTTTPHSVGFDIPLETAANLMRDHQIRHLPVKDGGKLVGIITDRDIKLASSFASDGKMTVEDVMTPDPYTVSPHAQLDEVALEMAEHKYGAAIVMDNGKVVGIFTSVDGLRILGELLQQNFKHRTD